MPNFDTREFLNEQLDKDFVTILKNCEKGIKWAEGFKTKDRDTLYNIQKYTSYLRNIGFLLMNNVKPFSLSEDEFKETRQLLENLVKNGIISETALKIYE
jgi:hypothetical protein